MRNVYSWNPALDAGCNPRDYSYLPEDIPKGKYLVKLDFKIWAKKAVAINCYFTKVGSGEKIILAVYRDYKTEKYACGEIDFSKSPTDKAYNIEVKYNSKGKPKLTNASIADSTD